ncbi:hypothetical protein [Marivita sp.]|uniref:hypothetical protein n=1 Tax=Marivita sp. TaxID=2003365 RepID=UPI003F71ED02
MTPPQQFGLAKARWLMGVSMSPGRSGCLVVLPVAKRVASVNSEKEVTSPEVGGHPLPRAERFAPL